MVKHKQLVTAIKVTTPFYAKMESLVNKNYHITISDIIRVSLQDYMNYSLISGLTYQPSYDDDNNTQKFSRLNPHINKRNRAISVKFPIKFLSIIDIIYKKLKYPNRSVFVRFALEYWISNNTWSIEK